MISSPTSTTTLRKPTAAALALVLAMEAPMAAAAVLQELSESALAEMRGKFVVGNQVQYFSMSVTTQWTQSAALADNTRGVDQTAGASGSRSDPGRSRHTEISALADNARGIDQTASASESGSDAGRSLHTETSALANSDVGYAGSESHGLPNAPTTHEVNLKLEVDNSAPQTKVAYSVSGTLGHEVPNTPAPAPSAALSQIDGAVQAIQVQGSDNVVRNNVGYAVIPASAAPVLTDAQVAVATPVDQTFVNGDMVTHVSASNGVGFTITSQGNQVTQRLGANPITNNSQLLQSVRLMADGQRIVNDLMLKVAFDNASGQRDNVHFRADRIMNLL